MAGKIGVDFDPYEILALEKECTDTEIVKAFRKAALKWHPDKNPERKEFAQQMFLKISKAFELLSDVAARAALDHLISAKSAHKIYVQRRKQNESEKRRRLREELEKREAGTLRAEQDEKKARQEFEEEIKRLRKEGSKLLQQERERIEREVHLNDQSVGRLKLKWKRLLGYDQCYDKEMLKRLFSKYGEVSEVVVSSKGNGSAIVDFRCVKNVDGVDREIGMPECPLSLSWLMRPKGCTTTTHTKSPNNRTGQSMSAAEFDDFEAEILSTMLSKGAKRCVNTKNELQ